MPEMRFSDISERRQVFVRQCQRIGYGRIEHLEVRACEPVFGSATESFIDVKLASNDSQRPELHLDDFTMSAEIRRCLSELDAIRDGVVEHLEIRAGIPRRMVFKLNSVEPR